MPDAPITDDEIRRFRDALDRRGAIDELDRPLPLGAPAADAVFDEPRSIRQPTPLRPGRGLADRARSRVHAIACWVVTWTTPIDERARF